MTRVSLTEDYDDRSVISKLNEMDKRVKENASVVTSAEASARQSAQSAQETADRFAGSVGAVVQNANAQINASKAQVDRAKAEVDETVTTVAQAVQTAEGAVTTANAASASAQQSAQTVAGYNTRLTTAEGEIDTLQSDLNSVTLRVQTAEGDIVTIQGRVTALETADGQNVKINRINDYALGLTGNQKASGIKGFETYTVKINPSFKRDVPTETYRYFTLEALSTNIGESSVLQSYFASGGGSQATIAQKNAGWDIYGKSSDNKDWAGRFTISLDPDNQRILLTLRLQNLTDGTTKNLTVATLSMV